MQKNKKSENFGLDAKKKGKIKKGKNEKKIKKGKFKKINKKVKILDLTLHISYCDSVEKKKHILIFLISLNFFFNFFFFNFLKKFLSFFYLFFNYFLKISLFLISLIFLIS